MECESLDGSKVLFIQSKYTISDVDDISNIFDKFKDFEEQQKKTSIQKPKQLGLFGKDESRDNILVGNKDIHYMIITAAKVLDTQKLLNYESSNRTSLTFYKEINSEKRLHFYDGPKILPIARTAYRKRHFIPADLSLSFERELVSVDNVYIGIINGKYLKELYAEFGDSLFLENLREWLGPTTGLVQQSGRETVNQAIAKTLREEPKKFLSRNNGITFRASKVTQKNENILEVKEASIVNGCQTTMSIINKEKDKEDYYVLVKVVETDDAWDIAAAANFQTKVDRIDLDIARYVRPQILSAAADKFGIKVSKPSHIPQSVFSVFDALAKAEVTEDEIRALFVGIFSRNPNNSIEMNYAELRTDLLEAYGSDPQKENILQILFELNSMTKKSADDIEKRYQLAKELKKSAAKATIADLFHRFWHDNAKNSPNYRSFLTILACCACVGNNIYENKHVLTYADIKNFLEQVYSSIQNNPSIFKDRYNSAFKSLATKVIDTEADKDKMLQTMHRKIKQAKFNNLYLILEAIDEN